MILSKKNGFIFIKTTKTAGTSVEVFLSPFCGDSDIITPIYPAEKGHEPRNYKGFFNPLNDYWSGLGVKETAKSVSELFHKTKYYNHMSASRLKARIDPDLWDNSYKFTIERNPWDKCVSWYKMIKNRKNLDITFSKFIREHPLPKDFKKYTDNTSGEILVDTVIEYSRLDEDLRGIFSYLEIPFPGLDVYAKRSAKGSSDNYREYYKDQEDIDYIANFFKEEISLFNYDY
ncbi:sulfotransferase family 2 domain-containing protein [Aidingimonas lacisalsi]|uniref:sulfotransferase family 2 domain-containing protein n=1 Tax=Aidingimonas lacisalsi TaxID=2604086 RepID=UPI0011D1F77F|nr:sulfotransferase family 2 domain-containing protein [Aidingimonas lacisalsi]